MTPELRAAGLLARLLPVLPPLRLRRWTDAEVPEDARQAVADLLGKLFSLAFDRWDDHLYEFQFGKRPHDPAGDQGHGPQ